MLELTRLILLAASALFCSAAFAETVNSSADSSESNFSAAIAASGACQQLQRTLGVSIVQSKSSGPEYSIAANAAWSAFNHEVNFQPTCIVFVKSTAHVQTAMRAIYQNNADYAVQSGGHSGMTGWNTNVGTGLLLGGGLSYLSPSQGYAADNYVSLDVVLVDGTLVTATANNQHANIFKALKGGGNRFGIYPNSSAEALLPAIAHFAHDTNDTNAVLATDFIASWSTTGVEPVIQLEMFYNGTVASFNESFAEFLAIPYTSSTAGPLSYLDLVNEVNFPYGEGNLFSGSVLAGVQSNSHESSDKLINNYMETYRLFNNFSITYANSSEIQSTLLSFTPVLQSQIRISYEKGGNAISPPMGQGGFNEVLFAVTYSAGVNQAPENIEQGRQFWIENTPRTAGLPLFVNEADANQQVLASYGEYNFLRQVYAKYDPSRFNVRHTPGPLGL
ncbi:FAD-binding domain-containing protein [Lentinula lateritia]|nr:FAD-binding domain-containing protein [Lentinula lateritia]